MLIFGLDLSGPRNTAETALVCFNVENATLNFVALHEGASDLDIYEVTRDASTRDQVIIGMDAPLSYNPGGGDRPGDTELRTRIIEAGLHSGAVMPPTLTRMVYLTLRGVVIARSLRNICREAVSIVEVHPSATMVLRGAAPKHVRQFRNSENSRLQLKQWLSAQSLNGLETIQNPSDHSIAACACALAGWKWNMNQSVWIQRANPPHHPYDFAC